MLSFPGPARRMAARLVQCCCKLGHLSANSPIAPALRHRGCDVAHVSPSSSSPSLSASSSSLSSPPQYIDRFFRSRLRFRGALAVQQRGAQALVAHQATSARVFMCVCVSQVTGSLRSECMHACQHDTPLQPLRCKPLFSVQRSRSRSSPSVCGVRVLAAHMCAFDRLCATSAEEADLQRAEPLDLEAPDVGRTRSKKVGLQKITSAHPLSASRPRMRFPRCTIKCSEILPGRFRSWSFGSEHKFSGVDLLRPKASRSRCPRPRAWR